MTKKIKNMTSTERKSLIKHLEDQLENKKKALELFKTFPKKFIELGIVNLVLPAQDNADELQKFVVKVSKQIELLKNPAVENMPMDEFEKYIKQ